MEFPFLSIITLSPILFAILILMLPKERGENARMLGLAAMVLGLVLAAYVYIATYQNLPPPAPHGVKRSSSSSNTPGYRASA